MTKHTTKKEFRKALDDPKPETRGKKPTHAYPWETMEVDKTFFGPDYSPEEAQKMGSLIQYYQTKLGKKFSMRNVGGTIKVWRDA